MYQTMTFVRPPCELINPRNYEQIVLKFMNLSKLVFPEGYTYVEKQSNGEPDYLSSSGIRYDAKLLFSTEQCNPLSKGGEKLIPWISAVIKELGEASRLVLSGSLQKLQDTVLFEEMLRRLPKEDVYENTIFFIPYPIVITTEKSVYAQFASDIVSLTYDAIVKAFPEKFKDKMNFIIYPSVIDGKMVLRNLTTRAREFVSIEPITPYVRYALMEYPGTNADIILSL